MKTINTKKIGKFLMVIGTTIVMSTILYCAFNTNIILGMILTGCALSGFGGL